MFEQIITQIVNGLVLGSMYTLCAVGLTLIFGIMNLINLAHGEFFMLGAYIGLFMVEISGIDPISATAIAMLLVFGLGALIEEISIKPMREKRRWERNAFIVTLGISMILQNLVLMIWGAYYRGRPFYFEGSLTLFGITIGMERMAVLVSALVLILGLWYFIHHTKIGTAMRATAQNKEAAMSVGIDVDRIYIVTFGIATALAAAAGSLLTPIFFVYPTVGARPLLKSFAVVILGGLGDVKGAIFSGFLIGLVEALTIYFLSSAFDDIVTFAIIIIVLILRPSGLFGVRR